MSGIFLCLLDIFLGLTVGGAFKGGGFCNAPFSIFYIVLEKMFCQLSKNFSNLTWLPCYGRSDLPRMGGMGLGVRRLLLLHHSLYSDDEDDDDENDRDEKDSYVQYNALMQCN